MSKWIIFDSGPRTGYENMKVDEWLARSWFPVTKQPVFRLYSWSPYTLSLGYHQPAEEVNSERLSKAGFDLVRRPTGGRAVFHAQEITYSIVMDATRIDVDRVYGLVSRILVSGLRAAGYDVTFADTKQDFSSLYRNPESVSCFTVSSRYEIQLNGRKLVGSAQRRYARKDGGVTALQHGSLLTGPAHCQLVNFLSIDENRKGKLKEVIERSSIDLSENNTRNVDMPLIASALKNAVVSGLTDGVYEERTHEYFISRMTETERFSTELI